MNVTHALRILKLVFGSVLILSSAVAASAQLSVDALALSKFEKDLETGKLTQTEKPLLDYALAHPNDPKALELMARLRLKQGRFDEAFALYRRVLSLDPQYTTAKVNYATGLLLTGQSNSAIQLLKEIDPSGIKDLITRLDLAQAHVLAGNCQAALSVMAKLPAAVLNTDALAMRAKCYLQLGDTGNLNALIPLAKRAVTLSPNAVMRFAAVMIDAGQAKTAEEVLTAVSRSMPTNSTALTLLGKAEILEKNFTLARQHLERAAKLEKDSTEIAYLLAELEMEQGHAAAAVTLLKRASQLAPDSPDILAHLAMAAIKANQPSDAAGAAEKLLTLRPDDPDSLYMLGAASLQGGDLQKAQTDLERFTALRPTDSRGCLALGLTLASQTDKIDAARNQLLHCLEIDSRNVEARYQLGLSYKSQGDTAKAIGYLEETVKDAPKYAAALRDLGSVYLQSGNESKARETLERAVAIDPNDAETHFQLSRLYNLIGEPALAKRHLDLFQKLKNVKNP